MKSWWLNQLRKKARIYILPTKMGGYLNGLIFLMFLLSIGYSNNLLLIFTLFLFGLNLMWVIQTHFHLHSLRPQTLFVSDGHARENIPITIYWKKSPEGKIQWDIELIGKDSYEVCSATHTQESTLGLVQIPKRGVYEWSHLKVQTQMPFGLYRAWVFLPVQHQNFVYPEKLKNISKPEVFKSQLEGTNSSFKTGPHDVWTMNSYQGDDARKINWKHYARSGELVIKVGEEQVQNEIQFRLQFKKEEKEYFLSKLATQMVDCAKNEMPFSFETSQRKFGARKDPDHLRDCLKELAKC